MVRYKIALVALLSHLHTCAHAPPVVPAVLPPHPTRLALAHSTWLVNQLGKSAKSTANPSKCARKVLSFQEAEDVLAMACGCSRGINRAWWGEGGPT
jgi:hypothetical protein